MATLDLTIGSTAYRVEIHPRSYVRLHKLNDPKGTIYDILYPSRDTPASCDCPDYLFRRAGLDWGGCKHVKALTEAGILPVSRVPQTAS